MRNKKTNGNVPSNVVPIAQPGAVLEPEGGPKPELFSLTREELFEIKYFSERVARAKAELAAIETELRAVLSRVGTKYMEDGRYQQVQPLNLETGQGVRVRVT